MREYLETLVERGDWGKSAPGPELPDEIVVFGSVWGYLGGLFAWAIAFFLLGHGMFMLKRHKFADLI